MSKCVLDVWEGRIPTCMAGYLVCDEEKCPNFIQDVKIEKAILALEQQEYFRNCKDCGCLEGNCNHDRCTKFNIGVNPELDGCTFYEDWGV